ncbi:MAG TPA: hypothetical protein VG713_07575 [Pirellulales bacterium]|nr:hypothetical protein [Pirellulales bacterium]
MGLGYGLAQFGTLPLSAVRQAEAADSSDDSVQKIVVHLTESEGENALHSALMAFGLATALQKQSATVTVMLDSEAPSLVKASWADRSLYKSRREQSPMTLGRAIKGFVDAGGTIVLCPHCAASCGCDTKNITTGAKLGQQGELARVVLEANKILDY